MPGGLALMAPAGLLSLVALGIILVLHMRRRTPPTISLPSLRFWEPVEADRSDRRKWQRPPFSWPLLLQLLAALMIGLALARPLLDTLPGFATTHTAPRNTIIMLDGSTSMLALAEEGDARTRWDMARNRTIGELDEWQAGDVITVIVAANQTQTISASTAPQIAEARQRLSLMEAPGGTVDVNAALSLASHLVLSDRQNRVLLVTDGALQVNPDRAKSIAAPIELVVVGVNDQSLPNVAVTAIGSRTIPGSDGRQRLTFSLSSFAAEAVRLPYRVQADGVDVLTSERDLQAGETQVVEVSLPPGSRLATVTIDVRDPFQADNSANLLLERSRGSGLSILLLSDSPGPLERALAALPESTVDIYPTSTPGLTALSASYDLTVFDQFSPQPDDIPITPLLLVGPTPLGEKFTATGVLSAPTVDRVDATSPLLEGVDLGGVTFGDTARYQLTANEQEVVRGISSEQTGPLIWQGTLDDQPYVVLGFNPISSNITQRVAFPILIARIVDRITAPTTPALIAPGDSLQIAAYAGATNLVLINPLDQETSYAVPASGPVVVTQTNRSGIHTIRQEGDSGQTLTEFQFVINAGSLAESDLRPNENLAASLTGGTSNNVTGDSDASRSELWPLLAVIGLITIVVEWIVSRFSSASRWSWRRPTVRREAPR